MEVSENLHIYSLNQKCQCNINIICFLCTTRALFLGKGTVVLPASVTTAHVDTTVPEHIQKPPHYANPDFVYPMRGNVVIQKPVTIAALRKTSQLAANILRKCPQVLEVKQK